VVEERDLPVFACPIELFLEPCGLRGVRVRAVQREEPDVLLRRLEGVVQLAVHVEQLVVALPFTLIVVSKRGIELHACRQHCLVGFLELRPEVLRALRAIQVVPHRDDQLEREPRVNLGHLGTQLVLRSLPGAEIPEHGELEGALAVRELEDLRRCGLHRRLGLLRWTEWRRQQAGDPLKREKRGDQSGDGGREAATHGQG
jgi:hypothetical protein